MRTMPTDFDHVYERTHERVWKLCCRLSPTNANAEDAFQDIFMLVFRYLAGYRGEATVETWCYRIALNHLYRARRRSERQPLQVPLVDGSERQAGDQAEALNLALDAIDVQDRQLITLIYLCEMPQQEVADQLGMPLGTLHSRLSRARMRMKKELARHGY